MEQTTSVPGEQLEHRIAAAVDASSSEIHRSAGSLTPQHSAVASCPTCAGAPASQPPVYIYALGNIEPRAPSPGVDNEIKQVIGRTDTRGKTDRETLHAVLSARENRYLLRKLCWVFSIQGLETYLLVPRDPSDFDLLLDSIRPAPRRTDIDVVIGVRGPTAPPEMCNGLMVPVVAFNQTYSFDSHSLIKSIPRPPKISAKDFEPAAEELVDRVMLMRDNAGCTDENRALNYLVVRYPAIYAKVAEQFATDAALSAVEAFPSNLSATRSVMDVVLSFRNRKTDVVEKFFVRVDVTEEFPFLVTKLSPYYDR